ncbi:MAG: fumarylacetoacetate hydrolase family protein [Candidatus Competibacteraceae bacterium]|nr:fumarylacetoacetate hydrolase family protein [Candidatus Competibacteraceae bacterium]MCB1810136.1 fumarylacetoacetate hydrolase family protein [Candidatus Competibacteraceae bacterium]
MNDILQQLAATVDEAAHIAQAIPQLSLVHDLSLEQAYEIQRLSIQQRLARGERRVGVKMGLTSRAKMEQVGVDRVIWGRLTDAMQVEEGSRISLSNYVHPRAEPEVAFLLKQPLAGKVTITEAAAAVEAVAPAIEIIDSRYENFKFSLSDVVADNSSSSGFVVGRWNRPDLDIDNLGIVLEVNGRPAQVGSSAAILGSPWRALAAAAELSALSDEPLQAGWIVLAGGATAAVALHPGARVRATIAQLGSVSFNVDG